MLCRFFPLALSIFVAGVRTASADPPAFSASSFDPNDGWKIATKVKDVTIYSRLHPGSHLKEFTAVGSIDASTRAVHAVLDDFENYPAFMPFTVETRLIKREGDSIVGYQRLSPKICADRDYTLRVWKKSWPAGGGLVFRVWWTSANEFGPPEKKGVMRVKVCDGSWLLEPDGALRTRATYSVFTDVGGLIPAFLANYASQTGINRLFEAMRKQVKDPKYALAN
jgi:hypothetical protein